MGAYRDRLVRDILLEFNPHHDEHGRFASGEAEASERGAEASVRSMEAYAKQRDRARNAGKHVEAEIYASLADAQMAQAEGHKGVMFALKYALFPNRDASSEHNFSSLEHDMIGRTHARAAQAGKDLTPREKYLHLLAATEHGKADKINKRAATAYGNVTAGYHLKGWGSASREEKAKDIVREYREGQPRDDGKPIQLFKKKA